MNTSLKLQTRTPILGEHLAVLGTALGMLVIYTCPATANTIDTANATVSCSGYSLSVSASGLDASKKYSISYEIDITPSSAGFPITGSIDIPSGSTNFNGPATGSFALTGSYTFSGTANLVNAAPPSSIPITFSPTTITCPPPSLCTGQGTNSANFNGTPIQVGDYIWFNANFKAQGIPGTGATLSLTNSTISLTADQSYTFQVPNAQITFSPSASPVAVLSLPPVLLRSASFPKALLSVPEVLFLSESSP